VPVDELEPALADAKCCLRDLVHRLLKTRFVKCLLVELNLTFDSASGDVGTNAGDEIIAAFEEQVGGVKDAVPMASELAALR
jgi:hypothetical protein